MACSFFLLAAVSAQTFVHILLFFLAKLPVSIDEVLWDGSAGCKLRLALLFVVGRIRPVAELVITCHTQVHTLFLQLLLVALISVLEDGLVFATIFFGIRIAVIPAFTAFGTASRVTEA